MDVSRRPEGLKFRRGWLGALFGALSLAAPTAPALAGDVAGEFDYWVLSLSWSPQFCKANPGADQCGQPRGFIVHGLWPQHERGYPDYCGNPERVPNELVERMLPLVPDKKLVNQQWRKHGSCSGLPVGEYFLQVERAWRGVVMPSDLGVNTEGFEATTREVEERFIDANPGFDHDSMALLCKGRWLSEVRFCLGKDFKPRACGEDVDDRCEGTVNVRPNRYRKAQ